MKSETLPLKTIKKNWISKGKRFIVACKQMNRKNT